MSDKKLKNKKKNKSVNKKTNTFTAKWHNAATNPPKKNGDYLIVEKGLWSEDIIKIASYAKNLYKANTMWFEDYKKQAGFYETDYYNDRDVVIDGVKYWMELPEAPR